jgi:heptosyltransferase-2
MGIIKNIERKGKRLLIGLLTSAISTRSATREEITAVSPKRILVIRQHNQMGDMLRAVPALRAIKESYPGVEVTILTGPINRDVMLNNPYVDRVLTYNSRNPLALISLVRAMRRGRHDMVIVLHTVSFSFSSAMLGLMSGSRFRVGSTSERFGNKMSNSFYHLELPLPSEAELRGMNEAEHNLYPLRTIGIRTDDISPVLVPTKDEVGWADDFVSAHGEAESVKLVVHPGAGKAQNIWPPERFAEVVNLLAARARLAVFVVEGPRDSRPVAVFRRLCEAPHVLVAGRSVGEVAAVMLKCDLVLCNDTGIMHVSSAVGARTLAVFGPTDPVRWAPRCPNLHIARAKDGNLAQLDPAQVYEKAMSVLEVAISS